MWSLMVTEDTWRSIEWAYAENINVSGQPCLYKQNWARSRFTTVEAYFPCAINTLDALSKRFDMNKRPGIFTDRKASLR